jgi:hypothetical protein
MRMRDMFYHAGGDLDQADRHVRMVDGKIVDTTVIFSSRDRQEDRGVTEPMRGTHEIYRRFATCTEGVLPRRARSWIQELNGGLRVRGKLAGARESSVILPFSCQRGVPKPQGRTGSEGANGRRNKSKIAAFVCGAVSALI